MHVHSVLKSNCGLLIFDSISYWSVIPFYESHSYTGVVEFLVSVKGEWFCYKFTNLEPLPLIMFMEVILK